MARRKKLDFSGVESFTRCSEGQHTAKIVEVQENTTQGGDDMLTMVFEVIRGDSKGAKVFDSFVLTDKALWKLKQLLQVLGVKCDGKIALDLDKLVGKICDIAVYHEEYNGKLKARIDEYIALKRSDDTDDEDDDDDEDEEPEEKPAKKSAPKKKAPAKKKPEPEDDDDWDDDDDEAEEEKPKKKAPAKKKAAPKKKAPAKKKPEPEDDDDWDDDDDDWDDDDDEAEEDE